MDYVTFNYKTKTLEAATYAPTIGVQGDRNSRKVWFKITKSPDDYDISSGTILIAYTNSLGETGQLAAEDVELSGDEITFSFTVPAALAKKNGTIYLAVECVDENHTWRAAPCSFLIGSFPEISEVSEDDPVYTALYQALDDVRELRSSIQSDIDTINSSISTLNDDLSTARNDINDLATAFEETRDTALEKFISQYYLARRDGKIYSVKAWKAAYNETSSCIKMDANENLVCEPSTDTVEGRDDYADIPLFDWIHVNFSCSEKGHKKPIAIKGSTEYSEVGSAEVGTMFMTPFYRVQDFDEYYIVSISDTPYEGFSAPECAYDDDGNILPYCIVNTYPMVLASDGYLRSQPNGHCEVFLSADKLNTKLKAKNEGDQGHADYQFIAYLMLMIKYGTKNSQTIFGGTANYNIQYETEVQREELGNSIVLLKAQADAFLIGSTVALGCKNWSNSSADRGSASVRQLGLRTVLDKVVVDDQYTEVVLSGEPFATTDISNGELSNPLMLSSWHWDTGSSEKVLGKHDGSFQSNTDSKHPFRIHGIELMHGFWETNSGLTCVVDADFNHKIYRRPYGTVWSSSKSVVESTYEYIGTVFIPDPPAHYWIGDLDLSKGVLIPSAKTTSSNYGVGDYCYKRGSSGSSEWLAFGYLRDGANAGLSFLHLNAGLSAADWCIGARG